VVSAAGVEQLKITALGKVPGFGETSKLYSAGLPTFTATLDGVALSVKSKVCAGSTVRFTAAECAIATGSLPTPVMLKAYIRDTPLETVTVNGIPEMLGVTLAGLATQLGGAGGAGSQLRLTGLA
jgi:hypothetical protein